MPSRPVGIAVWFADAVIGHNRLLLVWFPLIGRLNTRYTASTGLPAAPFLRHWLAVTGALSALSAIVFALRLRGVRR